MGRVVVTGGAGKLGRACVAELILLPTDSYHVRARARSIEAMVHASTADP